MSLAGNTDKAKMILILYSILSFAKFRGYFEFLNDRLMNVITDFYF